MDKLTINQYSSKSSQKEKDEQDTPSAQQCVNKGLPKEGKFIHNHPTNQILDDPSQRDEFEMSMMGELKYFLRLQIKQIKRRDFH